MQTMVVVFFVFFAAMIVFAIVKSFMNQAQYTEAKQDYLNNPDDKATKIRLVETASMVNGNAQTSGLNAMAMMEATRDPVVINNAPQANLTAELEALASLHANGHLTDAEFEAAKAKLLN